MAGQDLLKVRKMLQEAQRKANEEMIEGNRLRYQADRQARNLAQELLEKASAKPPQPPMRPKRPPSR